ncbi:hybrid sensor histidine kinase/response regulator [Undibacterium crateris]|uniref:hybrid sensor histidine kinase/response regulator n=1 Tax=Undibacterium crateris TaxID=2528175 RepID=UPI001389EAF1|nr:Hpt domain-containing protein [Undibacterium crateris]NDI86094.1 response regulator [Undibacterium crateris]
MTYEFSNSPELSEEQFDTGPLSWVMADIREAINHSGKFLTEALVQDEESRTTTLLHAKNYLHQAHGALQIVDIDGVAIVTETIEELLERLQAKQLDLNQENIDVILDAFHAVLRYLEDLLSGASHQPVRLFPYYRGLLQLKGAERIHPADLFFPALAVREKIPELTVTHSGAAPAYNGLRQRFEKQLLTVLTAKDAQKQQEAALAMQELVAEIDQVQSNPQAKAFWVVMRAFIESVATGSIPNQQYVKQIFGRINLQIRRLVEGVTTIPERLLRDALFFIAQVEQPTPFVARVRQAYALNNTVPLDYDQKNYGQIAAGVLSSAKEQLTAVKNLWGRIANGESGLADKFSAKMKDLAETGNGLNSPALSKLLRELSGIARHVAHSEDGNKLALELATSLLFVENALDQITRLPAHFAERSEEITSRLLSVVSGDEPQSQAAWMGEISREAQQRQTMSVLVAEMQASLRQIEKNLDEYFRHPDQTDLLKPVDGTLHQIGGALAILDQDDAMRAVEHTRALITQFVAPEDGQLSPELEASHRQVAQNIGALSFFIETMQTQPETARKKFTFDPDSGVFRSHLLEAPVQKELLPATADVQTAHTAGQSAAVQTAEQELANQQQESARLAASLVAHPEDQDLQEQLKQSLESERKVATLLDDADASDRARAAIAMLDNADDEAHSGLQHLVAGEAQTAAVVAPAAQNTLPQSEEAIDAELLEIFLGEAEEVLEFVGQTLPLSRKDTDNQEYLTSLRRSFHTLKGSSRMVGLNVFGETAWHIEQVMNIWLSESKPGNENLYRLLERASHELALWTEELKQQAWSHRTGAAIIEAAQRVKSGLDYEDVPETLAPAAAAPHEVAEATDTGAEVVEPVAFAEPVQPDSVELDSIAKQLEPEHTALTAQAGLPVEAAADDAHEITADDVVGDIADIAANALTDTHESDQTAVHEPDASDAALSAELESAAVIEAEPLITDASPEFELTASTPYQFPETIAAPLQEAALAMDDLAADVAEDVIADVSLDTALPELTALSDVPAPSEEAELIEMTEVPADLAHMILTPEAELQAEAHTEAHTEAELQADALMPQVSFEHQPEYQPEYQPERSDELLSSSPELVLPETEIDEVAVAGQILSELPVVVEAGAESGPEAADLLAAELPSEPELTAQILAEIDAEVRAEMQQAAQQPDELNAASVLPEDQLVQVTAQNEALDPVQNGAKIIEFPDLSKPAVTLDDNIKRIGDLEISLPLFSIYMAETDEIVRFLSQDFAEWRHESYRPVTTHAIHATHSLAGSSATVGLKPLQELAHSLELVLQRLARHSVVLQAHEYDVLDHALDTAKRMLQKFALSEMADYAPDEVKQLEALLQDVISRSDAGADEEFITSTNERLDLSDLSAVNADAADAADVAALEQVESAELAQAQLAPHTEAVVSSVNVIDTQSASENTSGIQINDELDQDLLPVFIEEGQDLLPMVGQLLRSWQDNPADSATPQAIARLMHTIKGSARMAGAMGLGQHIHDMETRIESLMAAGSTVRLPLLDDLMARHDLSMQMFDQLQNPEAFAQPAVSDAPLTAAQELDQFQEAMVAGEAEPAAKPRDMVSLTPLMPLNTDGAKKTNFTPAVPAATPAAAAGPVPLVRVRADVLDRLVNQAGEVSISRSRLENEVGTLRSSLSELTENVNRLRSQLREVEIQAETQITSRMAHSGDREFDPLEFDRFTRLQELTRMMAESVSDVATVQTNLTRTIDGASGNLHVQARLTRELQQDLMRVRMIPFASVSERLYRVTRQTAKELDKRVNLDIRGSNVEMDRGVLEKMVGPFEHLLRNAIVHGIESREQRKTTGKNETGELLIEIRQEGNEVMIRFKDDGQGLNLNSIREKALSVGLLSLDDEPGEAETAGLIFEPGFTTASEVTELAGRGVGMDVVRSEAASLGGRVEVVTSSGQGAEFTIHLPLTLAVTQVVLLSAGGRTFAVPSVLVEQVQHLKSNALANAYNDGAVMWQGQRVAMHFLSSLLGHREVVPMAQQYTPLLIMKSGTERVALHIDEILGNREVVVKNIGPQLARMAGIAGATVLGSGEIVLILNPVPLAQRFETERARLPQAGTETVPGAVADLHHQETMQPVRSEPVQGLRTQHTVMVVDDSLTVRRVTQRLLTREGYQVILAKDGIDALEQLQSVTPDVMLVDIEMPRMDGFDLTRNVRSDSRTKHIPIIMITSRTADKHRNYAKELGVNEYFGKPYREDDLLAAIVHFVGQEHAVIV